jgi:DNA-binding NarL/FixJ family response regulator
MALRIVLVDDHKVMRDGLRALLALESDIEVVGEASDGAQALEVVRACRPDAVVMDIGMPGVNGIQATRNIVKELPSVRVIALSVHTDRPYVSQMLEAGASTYVTKIAAHSELVAAIRGSARDTDEPTQHEDHETRTIT